jgi:uncharacterized membrane protein
MRALGQVAMWMMLLGYPAVVYYGLTRWSVRGVAALLLVLLVPMMSWRWSRGSAQLGRAGAALPLGVAALLIASLLVDDQRFVLAMPVLINGWLFAAFAATLSGTPMIERFARLQSPELSNQQIRYCRRVTHVWTAFFLLNGVITGLLALFASARWWAIYTGLIAYVLIGLLGTVEFLARRYLFREFGNGVHDRVLEKVLPERR